MGQVAHHLAKTRRDRVFLEGAPAAKNHRDDMTTTSRLGSLACLPGVPSNLPASRGC
jgi:hypothetical protein